MNDEKPGLWNEGDFLTSVANAVYYLMKRDEALLQEQVRQAQDASAADRVAILTEQLESVTEWTAAVERIADENRRRAEAMTLPDKPQSQG